MKKALFTLFVIGSQFLTFSQSGEDKLGAWYMLFGTHKLDDKFSLHYESQLRLYEPVSNFYQFLPRVGINYHINSYSSVTAGYALVPTSTFYKSDDFQTTSLENRIWQQFILKNFIGRIKFMHRYRVEQRWINSSTGSESENTYLNRFRYFFKVLVPINYSELEAKTFYMTVYNELFMNVAKQPFDQNRSYVAAGYSPQGNMSIELGYLSRWVPGLRYDALQLTLFITTGEKKKLNQR